MKINTRISKITSDNVIIRNEKLSDMINSMTFSDAIFLILSKRKPNSSESEIFNAMLVSIIDHGAGTTSSLTSRFVMSGGNSLNTSVGSGVLALGDFHGGAIENAINDLNEIFNKKISVEEFVKEKIESKKTIYGYGHKVYKDKDMRVVEILEICKKLNYKSKFLDFVLLIENEIEKVKGKKLILNIDGLIAAILLEMGFDSSVGKGIFIIGRVPGLVAQSLEEKEFEKPVRRLEEDDVTYIDE